MPPTRPTHNALSNDPTPHTPRPLYTPQPPHTPLTSNPDDLDRSACGVGFIASRRNEFSHDHLQQALHALRCVEHRGACAADEITGDGAGVMTDIPYELFGLERNTFAIASLIIPAAPERQKLALRIFEETFRFLGLEVIEYRSVPIDPSVLGEEALATLPGLVHAIVRRPKFCRTSASFDHLMYQAKQMTRTKERESGIHEEFHFMSISSETIVYKALTRAQDLDRFYLDLRDPRYKTRFAMFHRRFSTNTRTAWDKIQPFRLIAHNGEINTISGNRSWGFSRERHLGLRRGELLTREGISDTGSLNEMVEALAYRSSIPHIEDILAIMMPPAGTDNPFYHFWSRAMEPWDGPAFVTYSDGQTIGARLDRNGFRPCRWALTEEHFYLASEAGSFTIPEEKIHRKGTLHAGNGVKVDLKTGEVHFRDPSQSREHRTATYDARLEPLGVLAPASQPTALHNTSLFLVSQEEIDRVLTPMVMEAKEGIGSMGDTARLAVLSEEPRPLSDYFYQTFAQVTNPPLDYIREAMVTDLRMDLGRRPNIFSPKSLIPPECAYEAPSPVLSLAHMAFLRSLQGPERGRTLPRTSLLDMTYEPVKGADGMRERLNEITQRAITDVQQGIAVLVLTDEAVGEERAPIPSLLALRTVVNALNDHGLRIDASIVVHTGEVRSTHQLATLVGFGASAVCPYLALELARYSDNSKWAAIAPEQREANLVKAFEQGLLKVMSKMGISVVRSYHSSKLFTAIGLGPELMATFFPGVPSPVGGIELEQLADDIQRNHALALRLRQEGAQYKGHQFKEQNKGLEGEKHVMTAARSKLIHNLVRETGHSLQSPDLYDAYLQAGIQTAPTHLRHLLTLALPAETAPSTPLDAVEPIEAITRRFGSGAMSFGAISAESQRDIFLAMKEIGGRSNSGEGGENPYYYTDGVTATTKQVASARFGVTAEYLMAGDEFQIKIAQGAKPGEGGQLMGIKVDAQIARARHASPGIDLISPPPLHDIYSIEDLKQLIYELRQLKPDARINVKLVSGAHIGTIAVGVAKAGADIIHISGGDGGTGAASLSSMKHAGLPWEIGLLETHRALLANRLRANVTLRVDGGLHTGDDIVKAATMGAEEFEFGKLLLIAQGCIMARICEKNTCPTGIATHDPRFKAKYKGTKDHVVAMMTHLAQDVRRHLAALGLTRLQDAIGRTDLLAPHPDHRQRIHQRALDLSPFLQPASPIEPAPPISPTTKTKRLFRDTISPLNQQILDDTRPAIDRAWQDQDESASSTTPTSTLTPLLELHYPITTSDRAATATLSGHLAEQVRQHRLNTIKNNAKGAAPAASASPPHDIAATPTTPQPDPAADRATTPNPANPLTTPTPANPFTPHTPFHLHLHFTGSAGQGFGVFQTHGLHLTLHGEANDSVCKAMSGGLTIIRPRPESRYRPEENAIIGNCALYGATGGRLHIHGLAGDRFAVRNSGATAVLEGAGLHACEYMTNGLVVILGPVTGNAGAGMTGGTLYLPAGQTANTNTSSIRREELTDEDVEELKSLIQDHSRHTGSKRAGELLEDWNNIRERLHKYRPVVNIRSCKEESGEKGGAETGEGPKTTAKGEVGRVLRASG